MLDNYQNRLRILKGTNAGSTAEIASFSMISGQMTLPAYTGSGAFPGSAAGYLAIDTSGNVITTTPSTTDLSALNSFSASINSYTSSINAKTGSFATTGSNTFTGNQIINGTITAQTLIVQTVSSSIEFVTGSTKFGSLSTNTHQFTGSVSVSGSITVSGSVVNNLTASFAVSASQAVSASFAISASWAPGGSVTIDTGSLVTTSSFNAYTASINATIADILIETASLNLATASLYNYTASINAKTGSFATTGSNQFKLSQFITGSLFVSSSGVATSLIGSGSGVFTVDGTSGRLFSVDDSLSGSLFSVNTIAGLPVIEAFSDNTVRIGQYNRRALFVSQSVVGINKETALNGVLDISGSTVITGSLIVSGSTNTIGDVSGSNARFTGTITAQTLVVQVVSSSIEYASGSNIFGTLATNTQRFTGSVLVSGSITVSGSVINTLTSSFAVSASQAVSASYGFQATSASFAISASWAPGGSSVSASYAETSSYSLLGVVTASALNSTITFTRGNGTTFDVTVAQSGSVSDTGSLVTTSSFNDYTASINDYTASINSKTGSFATTGSNYYSGSQTISGSLVVSGSITVSGSVINNLTASFAISSSQATSASYALIAQNVLGSITSASYAATASYILGGATTITIQDEGSDQGPAGTINFVGSGVTAAVSVGVATVTITGGGGGAGFPYTGSAQITGSLAVTGSVAITSASLDYQQNLSIVTGSYQVVTSTDTGSFKAAFFDYVAFSGSATRAGIVVSTWSNTAVDYYENYTNDVSGSTSRLILRAALSGSNIQLQTSASSDTWTVRSLIRLI